MQNKLTSAIAALIVAGSFSICLPQIAFSQDTPSVSVVTLQAMPGQGGQTMVVTPRGKVVPLPGAGVNSPTVPIYIGSQGGYWYIDKNGQNVDLTGAVQYMQQNARAAQSVPQYAPQPSTVNNYYQESGSSNSGSSGSSAAATGLAAGLGAATGAALTNAIMEPNYYSGVPYGYPMHYGAYGAPYYTNREGNNVYVNNSKNANINRNGEVNAVNVANAKTDYNQINNQHATALQQQNDWYNKQAQSHSEQFNNWQKANTGENPFMHPDAQNGWQNANQRRAQGGGDDNGGGRFAGRRNADGGGGDGGGRFAGRFGGGGGGGDAAGGGGGILGGRGGGGGRFGGGRRGR